jgi:Mrp family chromosome partitioning ATPase
VVLVDADFSNPGVAKQLSLAVQHGWESVLAVGDAVWEATIESAQDRLAIVPLGAAVPNAAANRHRLAATLLELAAHYEVVLIDAEPIDARHGQWLLESHNGVSGIVLAHDVRRDDASRLAAACLRLVETGARQLGIAETFVT